MSIILYWLEDWQGSYFVSTDQNVYNKARDVVLLEVEYSAHFPLVVALVLYVCQTIG